MRTPKDFIESRATDDFIEHDIEECGLCCHRNLMNEVAKEMLAKGNTGKDAISSWEKEVKSRWQKSKFYKFYQEQLEKLPPDMPRDEKLETIKKAFEAKNWEM